jgi:hypothetical protein
MPFAAPTLENYSLCGYAPARLYRGVNLPAYAEVAAASPGSGAIAQICADLDNLMLDCYKSGWDGYGANAISPEAYRSAQRFIYSLPAGIMRPTLSADPDGCVTFEWHVSPRRLVLVSVHPNYRIDYAALFGNAKSYGTEPFFDKLPNGFSDLIRRVYQA